MKRKLIKQMWADRRANIWMALELLIVSVVLFVISDIVYTNLATVCEPLGFDANHCYLLEFRELTPDAPDYVDYSVEGDATTDLATLMERLNARPEIYAASLSFNAYPYNPNTSSRYVDIDTINAADMPFLSRLVHPDFLKVFRIEGANGEDPEKLGEILMHDKIVLSDNALEYKKGIPSLKTFYGKQIVWDRWPGRDTLELHASFIPMKYSDFSSVHDFMGESVMVLLDNDSYTQANELVVRVKDNMDNDFEEEIMQAADNELRVGNWYISGVKSFDFIRDNFNRSSESNMRNTIVCALFLLINIFLGILGTFWFRTRQRVGEIALRMVCGASKGDIFRRILGEGQLLLLFVTPSAILIDYILTYYNLTGENYSYYRITLFSVKFLVCVSAAWALLAGMISLGVYFPARKAMDIKPAVALKEE